ncbi:MAG: glycosyltransferase family 4 protein [Candidatus Kerfeldbacteria bacterium]
MNKRIVHIIDSLEIGGAEWIMAELATGMDRSVFDVEVICLTQPKSRVIMEYLKKGGVPVRIIEKKNKLGIGMFEHLTDLLQKEHPEIVHTHLFAADVWGGMAASSAHVPVIISTEHGVNKDFGWMKNRLKCWVNGKRDAIVAVSESVRAYALDACSTNTPDKVKLIPNGINMKRFYREARKRPAKTPVIAVVGRLEPVKGHAELLAALPKVKNDYRLRIVGSGSLREKLEQQVADLGLQGRVTFENAREDVEQVYAEADIVAVPSWWEGLGLVAIEALASGCAVLASNVEGLHDVVHDEETGLLVDMNDPDAVASKLDRLLEDADLRFALTTKGQQHVKTLYSLDAMVGAYTTLYNELT